MVDLVNVFLAGVSILLGAVGWLMPRYTLEALDLNPGQTTMGVSEIRAASGALFVGLGVGAIVLGTPLAYAMIGFAWGGAAIGRVTSILWDEAPTKKTWVFFGVEAVVAAALLALNL